MSNIECPYKAIPPKSEDLLIKFGKAADDAIGKPQYDRKEQAEKYDYEYDSIIHRIKVFATYVSGIFFSVIIISAIST